MTATGVRARVRAQLTAEILAAARRQLATEGATALSVRAVARELGMASSAVYRYFPSRDDLLTQLIIEAYDALGEAAERAESAVPRDDLLGRWRAVCHAARAWAGENPHEWALIYGSPVPGYAAPQATIGPASRVGALLCALLDEAAGDGKLVARTEARQTDDALGLAILELMPSALAHGDPATASRAVLAWTSVFGLISFELFGHLNNIVLDYDRYFADAIDELAGLVGLPGVDQLAGE
jgi:AcrR family transcriptional regulator